MVSTVNITTDDEKFEEIKRVKDELGLTWREFALEGARCLEKHYED